MSDLFSLQDKYALVTGASRGLGKAIALGLAQAGAHVICSSSTSGGTDQTVKEIQALGRTAYGVEADLGDRESVAQLVQQALQLAGNIDILVNNGGTIARYPAIDYPEDEWDRVLEVNLTSAFRLSQLVGKQMIERGSGKIINIASMLSYSGGITVPAYTASKHGIAGITKALANEWAQYNIQINAVAPGYMKTDNTQLLQNNPERAKAIEARIPAGRWGEAEDVVGAVIFLASNASNYINGNIINVDGGWMAR
ncbi:MAG: 2-dehydro-3-deoxy-D-gluconate 5-dehydrogenase KduD [Bacteroidota bacterium]